MINYAQAPRPWEARGRRSDARCSGATLSSAQARRESYYGALGPDKSRPPGATGLATTREASA